MARISMNEMTTYRWSFEEDVRLYSQIGFDAIAIWRQKLSDFGEERGVELVSESGLAVSSLMWAGGFTGSDGRSHKESIHDALEALRLAGQLQASCLVVYSGHRAGHTHNHARRLLNNALETLLPVAAELGVDLALEPMHCGCAGEWTFLTEIRDTIELIRAHQSDRLKMVFDTYCFGACDDVLEQLEGLVDHLAVVQLADGRQPPDGEQNRSPLGRGQVPLDRIVDALLRAGYAGYFDIKLMGEEIEIADYEQLLKQSKQRVEEYLTAASN